LLHSSRAPELLCSPQAQLPPNAYEMSHAQGNNGEEEEREPVDQLGPFGIQKIQSK
jgi:hypothetical protein